MYFKNFEDKPEVKIGRKAENHFLLNFGKYFPNSRLERNFQTNDTDSNIRVPKSIFTDAEGNQKLVSSPDFNGYCFSNKLPLAIEIKYKNSPIFLRREQSNCFGIDLRKFQEYNLYMALHEYNLMFFIFFYNKENRKIYKLDLNQNDIPFINITKFKYISIQYLEEVDNFNIDNNDNII